MKDYAELPVVQSESELDIIPVMTSLPESVVVQRGDTGRLPCKATVKTPFRPSFMPIITLFEFSILQDSSQLVRIWQRDDGNVIFTGGVKVSRQDNHQLDPEENTTLIITNAQPHDAGGYTCRVMIRAKDEISVTHRLIVNTQSFAVVPVIYKLAFSSFIALSYSS